jgi:heptosyltransferase I
MDGVALNRVMIVMMSAVGDVVHVLPVINALKRHKPDMHIAWVVQPGPASLIRGHPGVDELIIFDRALGARAYLDIRRQLAARPVDVVLDLQVYLKAGIVTAFARAPNKLGFDRARARDLNWLFTNRKIPPHRTGQHVQDQYLEFLAALGVPAEPIVWNLGPWAAERGAQRSFYATVERPVAAIVVATSNPHKDWVPERWAEVAELLYSDYGLQPVLVGGTTPRERASEHRIRLRAPHARSALGSGLRGLVGIIDGADVVLSPDTGPLHMAVALDRPVVSLMGYTNPKRTGPYRRFQDLVVDAYGEPGEDYPVSMEVRPDRMSRITVSDVMEKIEVWRTRYAQTRTPHPPAA